MNAAVTLLREAPLPPGTHVYTHVYTVFLVSWCHKLHVLHCMSARSTFGKD